MSIYLADSLQGISQKLGNVLQADLDEQEKRLLQKNSRTDTLRYLAGYFEGEGSIFFNHPKGSAAPLLVLKVASGDKKILDKFAEIFGGEVKQIERSAKIAKRQMYRWERSGTSAQNVIKELMPFFLDIKKELAFLALVPIFGERGRNVSEAEREIRNRVVGQVLAINNRVTIDA